MVAPPPRWPWMSLVAVLACGWGCSGGGGGTPASGTGGRTEVIGSGGRSASGGAPSASGGGFASGGAVATGGSSGGAGRSSSGGGTATGGASAGGASAAGAGGGRTGGVSGSGGTAARGGASACTTTTTTTAAANSGDVVVNLGDVRQRISGFGASTAWGSTMSAADADLLFSPTLGAGLSLHRIRIAPDGTTTETNIGRLAQTRGATVWATPWSPAAAYKSSNNVIGGTLTNGRAWAQSIATFVTTMKAAGVNIYAVSAQNEPDASVTYESCAYSGPDLASFIGTFLGPALASTGVKIVGPESQNWCGFKALADPILNDARAAASTSIIATHEYGCAPFAYPAAQQAGKEFWQTEMYDRTTPADPGMVSALRIAKLMHDALTIAGVNAWHHWWVYPNTNDNGALWDMATNLPTKRLYVMGNFSRFVRPGFVRVGTTGTSPTGVQVTAYKNAADGNIVIVAVNQATSAVTLPIFIAGVAPCAVTPWVTSAADNLAARSVLPLTAGRFVATLGAQTVTTFVGRP